MVRMKNNQSLGDQKQLKDVITIKLPLMKTKSYGHRIMTACMFHS